MKLVMGSLPGKRVPVQVFLPIGQPYAGEDSAGVSDTRSPPEVLLRAQPPWKVWYRPNQWPACGGVGGRIKQQTHRCKLSWR
jgi:hypothetical protein